MKLPAPNSTATVSSIQKVLLYRVDIPWSNIIRWGFVNLWHYLLVAVLGWFCYVAVNHHLLSMVRVTGTSMRPTLTESDVYLLNRWLYLFRPPQQGDIVVIKDPSDNGFSIKRVIGCPGDSVCVKAGEVFVNGRKLNETYLSAHTKTFIVPHSGTQWTIGCAKGEYIVLGDNRGNSYDSREYGTVSRDRILGAVFPAGLH